jgi:hypothetical protein
VEKIRLAGVTRVCILAEKGDLGGFRRRFQVCMFVVLGTAEKAE